MKKKCNNCGNNLILINDNLDYKCVLYCNKCGKLYQTIPEDY